MAVIRTKKYTVENDSSYKIEDLYSKAKENLVRTQPFDIESFVKKYGIKISREQMDYDISGYIQKRPTGYVIGINQYHNPRRQRFTIAHEFAHYLMHKEIIEQGTLKEDRILFRNNENNKIEREANTLASDILIPEERFKSFIKNGVRDVDQLANEFDVSVSAIRYKAYKLGYIKNY